ncbi:zf-HC2 domain-containing protein [Pseudothauera rhizosphaerae]|uniref:Zf-HC2 domain-containing protein n=1 Tax=Pseudothauera rhizosphaerae TaxID=2565932 RepID=A0A4S4ATU4_9RHOO|nr:zf-HC2 domain-containing protein [Pseudothauera rhizosphaerae]THF63306.1 zf-HC2 domain-containing protein [Pseudothauera rhizosphaerae]
MLTCKDATRLCSEALDRPLTLRERLTLRAHLLICTGCTRYNEQMAALRRIAARFADGGFARPDGETDADGGNGSEGK